jgi:hypothetical protein
MALCVEHIHAQPRQLILNLCRTQSTQGHRDALALCN